MCHSIHSDAPRETRRRSCRRGFTLIELLVAIAIIVFLATLGVLLVPRLGEQQRATLGADRLQQWLLIAKQRALRTGLPCGVRFNDDPLNVNFMTEAYYVEQPPDFVIYWPDPTSTATPPPQVVRPLIFSSSMGVVTATLMPSLTLTTGQYDFTGGDTSGTNNSIWPVQQGDFLEVQGGGLLHQIQTVNASSLTLASAPLNFTTGQQTQTWRIIRGSRVITGEEPLKLPNNVGIFKGIPNTSNPSLSIPGSVFGPLQGNGNTPLEIMFAPSGRVLNPPPGVNDPLYFWVADSSTDDPTRQNAPIILSIKAATGFIGTYPVDITYSNPVWNQPGNPYVFAQGNRTGGL